MFWLIAGALVVMAVSLVSRRDFPVGDLAFGQLPTSGGMRGVFAFSGQLSKGTHGVYMVDTDSMTIWAYEYLAEKGCLRLAGARTWRYDRYLENYNGCDLPPEAVEDLVEEQRQHRLQATEQQMP